MHPLQIITPAGKCPVALKGIDQESVQKWAQAVIDVGLQSNRQYMPSALQYWVREFYEYGTDDHEQVCQIIDEMFEDNKLEAGETTPSIKAANTDVARLGVSA